MIIKTNTKIEVGEMLKSKIFYSLLFGLVLSFSCQGPKFMSQKSPVYEDGFEMVAEAKQIIDEISIEDFARNYFKDTSIYLIDVRELGEFEEGNIDGAVSIPRGVLEFRIEYEDFWREAGKVPPGKDDVIVLYCGIGNRSALATKTLKQLGYKNVHSIKGGWNAWVESNQ